MKIYLLFSSAIILIGQTENFTVQNTKDVQQQKILLRKLQNFEENNTKETNIAWNEILASVLVNKINIFPFKNNKQRDNVTDKNDDSILKKCFSEVLYLYKYYIYNNFVSHINRYNDNVIDRPIETKPPDPEVTFVDETKRSIDDDPKTEIELIEPKYHGRIEAKNSTGTDECPEGLAKNNNGECVDPKSKFILYIPSQCPIGYRRDRRGVCRSLF